MFKEDFMNINIKTEKMDNLGCKFNIELDKKEFDKEINQRLKYYKNNLEIKGFPKGKVPMGIIKKRFSEDIKNEVANELVPKMIQEAYKKEDFSPVGDPDFENLEIEDTIKISFVAYSEPEIEELDLEGIDATIETKKVTKKEIEEEINRRLENKVEFEEYEDDKEIEEGDFVFLDFKGFLKEDESEIEGGAAENHMLQIGEGSFIEDLEEGIIGMKKGDEDKIDIKFPEEYRAEDLAGKEAYFEVKINKVADKKYPELNDKLVKEISDFETVKEFKDNIKQEIEKKKEQEAKSELRGEVFDKVLKKNNEFTLPENIVEKEKKNYLEKNEEENEEKAIEEVEKSLRSYYILNKIAKDNNIDVSEDIDKYIEQYAQYFGGDKEKATEMLKENGMLDQIAYSAWEKKAIDKIIEIINKKDENEKEKKENDDTKKDEKQGGKNEK